MRILALRAVGVRCFEDTLDLQFANRFNIIVGRNNVGKSTILRSLLAYQGFHLDNDDIRPNSLNSWTSIAVGDVVVSDQLLTKPTIDGSMRFNFALQGSPKAYTDYPNITLPPTHQVFQNQRPHHAFIPFLAKRKASGFSQTINSGAQIPVTGTLHYLYSAIDTLATVGHPKHEKYVESTRSILGMTITTRHSNEGKVAGFYLDDEKFVTLDRMGDGVTEIVAIITELCTAKNKIFVLEEPETNLHPKGLKELLKLIRESADTNQFFIATHSNVVIRELGGEDDSSVYRVYRDGDTPQSPSRVEKVERTPDAHMRLLRELGYEFTDFDLHEGWLFLEESSAERIIRDVLIPIFVPQLRGRIRTFAAGGVDNLEPSVSEFKRLITFIHLQPAYDGRIWVRADGDDAGTMVINRMRATFPKMDQSTLSTFSEAQFEYYFPEQFRAKAEVALAIKDKNEKRKAKSDLLEEVLAWNADNKADAEEAWEASAGEIIELLKDISNKLSG